MRKLSQNRLLQAAAVAAGIVALSTNHALARSHGSYGSYGSYGSSGSSASYGSYAGYGSSSSGSSASYGSYGSYGSSGSSASYGSSSSGGRPGLFARWHANKAARASSGSSASYGGYYASSSGSSASYGSSSGGYGGSSSGSSASYGGYSTPAQYYDVPVETAPAGGVPMESQPAAPVETSAAIRVSVPTDAKVFVNDRLTTSTGAERSFVSHGLNGGHTYAYQLRVEFNRDGQRVVENKLVRLQPGQSIDLSFGNGQQVASKEAASTELTLHVPAGASVTLAGATTQQSGEVRTYATSSLAPGQEWNGYVVRVELQKDGKTLVEEKTLSIVGGEKYELSFDFAGDGAQVASLN